MTQYVAIKNGEEPPEILVDKPYLCLVLVSEAVEIDWQYKISEWLVKSGCLFMMAWGLECSSWDDSVDEENLREFGWGDIPDDRFVMTSWHENEPLEEVVSFAKVCRQLSDIELPGFLILDIGAVFGDMYLCSLYEQS